MISEAEIRRVAAATRVDPMVIDLDYSLGWFLLGLRNTSASFEGLIFKGGTCLRKCYFSDYRFSEDLDFTASKYLSLTDVEKWITRSIDWIVDQDGPDFRVQPILSEVIADEYGNDSYQARIYYHGPLRWGGSPRTVKLDITQIETILLPINKERIIHPYSDQADFEGVAIPCYSLEEIAAEKIRAIGGQRRFAISRDIYDLNNLILFGIDMEAVKKILPEKFRAKGLDLHRIDMNNLEQRRSEFETDWKRRLKYLVKTKGLDFETSWKSTISLLKSVII